MVRKVAERILLLLLLFLCSCVKDRPNPPEINVPLPGSKGMLILNEGAYGMNNAELTWATNFEDQWMQRVFFAKNQKPLGDVAQHVCIIDGHYWISLNNSGAISIIDTATFEEVKRINGVSFPRYILPVNEHTVYVSTMYSDRIILIDRQLREKKGELKLGVQNPEHMLKVGPAVYICPWDTASAVVCKVDASTHTLSKTITLAGRAAHDVVQDALGRLWVLSGNKYAGKPSVLSCIDPSGDSVLFALPFPAAADPMRLQTNLQGDTLLYIQVDYFGTASNNGLFRMGMHEKTLAAGPWIPAPANTYFWGFGIRPLDGHVLISDPKGFTQQSNVYEYGADGKYLRTYSAGIGASQFLFP